MKFDRFKASLVDDLQPVRPMRLRLGLALAGCGLIVAVMISLFGFGPRTDLLQGKLDALSIVTSLLFLTLGCIAAVSAVGMAQPAVGSNNEGWRPALIVAAILPVAGVLVAFAGRMDVLTAGATSIGTFCVVLSLFLGAIAAPAIIYWLRKGAPGSSRRAGQAAGLAAACFGVFAWSLHCPINHPYHLAFWHGLVPMVGFVLGQVLIAPLTKW